MINDDAQTDDDTPGGRSAVAEDLADLKSTVTRLIQSRERLPQPMFWSLFNARINDIKKHKELERLVTVTLNGD